VNIIASNIFLWRIEHEVGSAVHVPKSLREAAGSLSI